MYLLDTQLWESAHPKVFPTLMGSDTCPMGPCHMLLGVAYEIPIGWAVF